MFMPRSLSCPRVLLSLLLITSAHSVAKPADARQIELCSDLLTLHVRQRAPAAYQSFELCKERTEVSLHADDSIATAMPFAPGATLELIRTHGGLKLKLKVGKELRAEQSLDANAGEVALRTSPSTATVTPLLVRAERSPSTPLNRLLRINARGQSPKQVALALSKLGALSISAVKPLCDDKIDLFFEAIPPRQVMFILAHTCGLQVEFKGGTQARFGHSRDSAAIDKLLQSDNASDPAVLTKTIKLMAADDANDIAVFPGDPLSALAEHHRQAGDLRAAQESLEQLRQAHLAWDGLSPPGVELSLARNARDLGQKKLARERVDRLIYALAISDPDGVSAELVDALVLQASLQTDPKQLEASALLERAIAIHEQLRFYDPQQLSFGQLKHAMLLGALADQRIDRGDDAGALASVEQGLLLQPFSPHLLDLKGRALARVSVQRERTFWESVKAREPDASDDYPVAMSLAARMLAMNALLEQDYGLAMQHWGSQSLLRAELLSAGSPRVRAAKAEFELLARLLRAPSGRYSSAELAPADPPLSGLKSVNEPTSPLALEMEENLFSPRLTLRLFAQLEATSPSGRAGLLELLGEATFMREGKAGAVEGCSYFEEAIRQSQQYAPQDSRTQALVERFALRTACGAPSAKPNG